MEKNLSSRTIIKLFLQAIAILTFIGAIGWFIFEPGFEPALAILASIAVFLSPLFLGLEEEANEETLLPADECEPMVEIQLSDLVVGVAETGGGGVINFLNDYVPKNEPTEKRSTT